MSAKHPPKRARVVAEAIVGMLGPACERIAIAGSIRRGAPEVKDIEIVAVPKLSVDLLGETQVDDDTALDVILYELESAGRLERRDPPRWGRRFKAARAVKSGIPVDLFLVLPPAQWGAIMAIRTGPALYSAKLVTACQYRGYRCIDGRLVGPRGDVPTPEEKDFFAACGVPFVAPEERA